MSMRKTFLPFNTVYKRIAALEPHGVLNYYPELARYDPIPEDLIVMQSVLNPSSRQYSLSLQYRFITFKFVFNPLPHRSPRPRHEYDTLAIMHFRCYWNIHVVADAARTMSNPSPCSPEFFRLDFPRTDCIPL
ncbi:hypothetical protein M422DRAFT_264353 [Sphaerobolus stellatus SS14]|uniref:Unplaced genomic scaffold SPHSTscaffold_135, whole genome shotgun sequence n=1 Tax=Sphaerobolus stellatus (strain SS14) TaxID=990650 RepID=A0A0C9UWE9_SPHS4|nr:hypothetical protein M422DRAFT_264353 [Sphaerobolus stellatus SS14]